MPSSQSLQQRLQVLSGNVVQIYFGNTVIGFLQNFSAQTDYGLQPVGEIGSAKVQEWVPGMQTITLTADRCVLRMDSLQHILDSMSADTAFDSIDGILQGYVFDVIVKQAPPPGAQSAGGAQPTATSQPQSTAAGGTALKQYMACSLASESMSIGRNAVILTNVTIHPIDQTGSLSGTGALPAQGST